jgi:purine-nucleoside/S-methyl-5'-thioadenosine phosphorylase / adenosine deaminase
VTARSAAAPDGAWRPVELAPGALAAFTSRPGGVSAPPFDSLNLGRGVGDDPAAVARNRQLAAQACGRPADGIAWMRQVHGTDVAYAAGSPVRGTDVAYAAGSQGAAADEGPGPAPEVDALFTDVPGLALGVLVADCAPVLIADPQAGIIGAAHAGREGMAGGVVPALVRAMTAAGADPARMRAALGPAICGCCYEVPALLRARIAAAVPQAACRTRKGSPGIDIRSGVAAQLAEAGVRAVRRDPRCTAETPGLYSYRRDGQTGRFAGLVWLA